mgnify:FL=1
MDYSYEYTSLETSSSAGGMIVYMIIMLAVAVFSIVSMWKVFKKAGKEGWAALIPIYNLVVLFQISGIDPKKLLWFLLPFIGQIIVFVYLIMAYINLAKAFGKSSGFAAGLIFLNVIFMGILAFDDSVYSGTSV